MALLKLNLTSYPCLVMQPKVIQRLRPYYTYMQLRSATFNDRGRIRQFLIQHCNHKNMVMVGDANRK